MMGFLRVAILLVAFGGVAVAQPKPAPPTAAQKAEIDKLAKRAITKSQAGDHEGAIKDLLEAHAIHPTSANVLLTNVGHEYKQLKKPYEALKYYCMYLEKEPTGTTATYVKAETEVLKKDLKLEGEVCAARPDPMKPDPPKPDPPKPDPPPTTVTGTQNLDKPSRPGGALRVAGLGVGVVGVAVLAGGIFYGIKAAQNSDKITQGPPAVDPNCTDPDPAVCMRIPWDPANPDRDWEGLKKLDDDGAKFEKLQIALTVAGSAMVVAGVAIYFVGRSKGSTKESSTRVAPSVAPGTAGLTVVGSF